MSLAVTVVLGGSLSPLTIPRAEAQSASTYYVSPTGSDGNIGNESYPLATITRASSIASPGDTVIVEDGTYYIPAGGSVGGSLGGDWAIGSNGTPGHPITYIAQHKWQAKLVGQGTGDGSTVVGMQGGYNILENFDVTGTDANGINMATIGTSASYNQAIGNYVHDLTVPCDSDGGTAIVTGGGDNYTGITHIDIIGNLVANVVPTGGSGCSLHTANGLYVQLPYSTVANNIVINAGYCLTGWHAASYETFFGNTLVNCLSAITVGSGDSGAGVNDYALVQNNIIYNTTNDAIQEVTGSEGSTGAHNQYIDNLIYAGDTAISLNNGLQATGTVSANPLFNNNTGTAAGDYHVQSSSPARGTGLALKGILTDFDGASRPQSGATVIGALLGTNSTTVAAGTTASPTSIRTGQSSVITWTTQNAVSATLNGTTVALNGSVTVRPTATTTYTIVATSSTGATTSGSATVTVNSHEHHSGL